MTPGAGGPGIPPLGHLGDLGLLPRLLVQLAGEDWSGAVAVRSGDVERRVFLAEGRINTATSTDPADTLVERLVADGAIAAAEVQKAAAHVKSAERGWPFGRQLVRLGQLDETTLARAERERVIDLVETMLVLRTGEYETVPGAVAGESHPPQGLEVARVVATAVLGRWEDAWALDALGGERAVLDIVPDRLLAYERTDAAEEYDLALLRVNGRSTVREVVEASPLPAAPALRFLAAARVLGAVTAVPGARAVAPPRPAAEASRPAAPHAATPAAPRTDPAPAAGPAPGAAAAPGAASGPPHAASAPRRSRSRPWLLALLLITIAAVLAYVAHVGLAEIRRDGEAATESRP